MKLRFHRRAVEEIDDEVDYYESRQPGLGAALEDEIDAVLDVIVQHPEAAPKWKDRPDGPVILAPAVRIERMLRALPR